MTRLLFAPGARGGLVHGIQSKLGENSPDGIYGNGTAAAVKSFQETQKLPATGNVDDVTWTALMQQPVPPVRDRCLNLTSTFEGHGFTLAQGNFDGAGITWGIIGFTLEGGELAAMLKDAYAKDPQTVRNCFADCTDPLLEVLAEPWPQQLAWADSLSSGASKASLAEPWKSAFARLGETPLAQSLQLARVEHDYFVPALATAKTFGFKTELGAALCFDIHVQDGGPSHAIVAAVHANTKPGMPESDVRALLANAIADHAQPQWRDDVRNRKLAIARGTGTVHGLPVVLRNWGLDELPI